MPEVLAEDEDLSGRGPVLTQDQAQECRLARTRGTDEKDELPLVDLQVDVP
ncbi:hypothetical protein SDC9_136097 [bioreactor metagenome]|uniref:Uncharacterized protein n=1 Tax=bioreactor metagenome TaxID=1076179 RepID=A0A645DI63_9ZZZZ